MKGKRIIALLVVVGLAATALAATFSASKPLCRPWPVYDPAGTWIWRTDDGGAVILNLTPCDPARNKLTMVADTLHDCSWLFEYFGVGPVAAETKYWGTMVKTGRNTYQWTGVAYGVDENFNICFWAVSAGTIVQTEPDTFEGSGAVGFYTPDQDPFGDEPPAIWSGPETSTYTRMPIVPPPAI